ncbi:Hypothetical predicted protein, partial [Paramuricea clavata]
MRHAKEKQTYYHNRHGTKELSPLKPGELVRIRPEPGSKLWRQATVVDHHSSPRSYIVDTGQRKLRRNRVALRLDSGRSAVEVAENYYGTNDDMSHQCKKPLITQTRFLKIAASVIAHSLTGIFTASINTGIFPYEWKASRVTPVFKSGTRNNPGNYRPISIIPCVAKIFEKIIFDQLHGYLDSNNLLNTCQYGFRPFHSTLTALLEATSDWSMNIDNGLINGVVFIDLKKAFDTIDHQIILQKLKNYGIDETSLTWFHSYLTDRTQKCRVNGQLSDSVPVACGFTQGSSLGPLLFLIYINDLPNCLDHTTAR